MRREYGGILRAVLGGFVAFMLSGTAMGAILIVKKADSRSVLTALGILLFVLLFFLALYLIVSDEKRLVRSTPYGQALERLGDPRGCMAAIDQSARERFEEHGSFVLTKDWLIVRYARGWRLDPRRVCAQPIPRAAVKTIRVSSGDRPRDPQERRVIVAWAGGCQAFSCFQQQDLEALKNWMAEREAARHE